MDSFYKIIYVIKLYLIVLITRQIIITHVYNVKLDILLPTQVNNALKCQIIVYKLPKIHV